MNHPRTLLAPFRRTLLLLGLAVASWSRAAASDPVRPASAAEWHNLGVAAWERGLPGTALLAWERALWLDPNLDGSRRNLAAVRQARHLEAPPLAWWELASTWLPARAWSWIAAGAFWTTAGLGVLSGGAFRRAGPATAEFAGNSRRPVIAAAALSVFLLSLFPLAGVESRSRLGLVTDDGTELRLTPTREAQPLATLKAGETARLVRTRGAYLRIRTADGTEGWVEKRCFALVAEGGVGLPELVRSAPPALPAPDRAVPVRPDPSPPVPGARSVASGASSPSLATSDPGSAGPPPRHAGSIGLVRRPAILPAGTVAAAGIPERGRTGATAAPSLAEAPEELTDQSGP